MCSQRTRSADIGFSGGSILRVAVREQGGHHVVGVGGLGEIIDGAELHRVHRGGDIAVAGQDDAARVGPAALERARSRRGRCRRRAACRPPRKPARPASTCRKPSATDSAVVTAKPRCSSALASRCRNDRSSSTISNDRSPGIVSCRRVGDVAHGHVHVAPLRFDVASQSARRGIKHRIN